MHLLIVTPYYDPDLGPSAPLVTMLAEDLSELKFQVTVVAAAPHYPSGRVNPENNHWPWRWDSQGGVQICRVWVPSGDRSRLWHRTWVFLVFQFLAVWAAWGQSYEALMITNPALEIFLPFWLLGVLQRKPILLCVWDLYPEAGIRARIFRSSLVIAWVRWVENYCIRHAALVQILSESFQQNIIQRGVSVNKIVVIPPWLDIDFIKPLSRRNDFSAEYALTDSFVVMHAGNIGYSQGLDDILETADKLVDNPRIKFVFVGDGAEFQNLMNKARSLNLENLAFIPFQPRQRLPHVLASADLALVCQKVGFEMDSLPSKIFPALASGRPILAVVSPHSPVSDLLAEAQAGVCVPPGEPTLLAEQINRLLDDPERRRRMGDNGRTFAEQRYTRKGAAARFADALHNIVT
jgi:colanic acid biosynthesis glycosyl transferase WcaI